MTQIRLGTPGDAARERELWQLAFGDDGAYVDNFYQTYYKPERMLLLEEDGVVQSMTAWFDTQLVLPGEGRFRAAYPLCRGHRPGGPGPGAGGPAAGGGGRILPRSGHPCGDHRPGGALPPQLLRGQRLPRVLYPAPGGPGPR